MQRLIKFWLDVRDFGYKLKLFIGFNVLGWHKPKDYEYGYFVSYDTVVLKYRDKDRIIHTNMIVFPGNGVDYHL
jgi:hypothetical protein